MPTPVETLDTQPLILLTNDDGVLAPGLGALALALADLGEVCVFAPDRNRSGVSHMITLHRPLRCRQTRPGWWTMDGTPADCVYLALHGVLKRRPSLIVSGINAGPNLSFDTVYSGTLAGAREGALHGVPSFGVSLADRKGDYGGAAHFSRRLAEWILKRAPSDAWLFNVNVPGGEVDRFQTTFLGQRPFHHAVEHRSDPRGESYYWIGGTPALPADLPGSDCNAVAAGTISVTSLSVRLGAAAVGADVVSSIELDGFERLPSVEP